VQNFIDTSVIMSGQILGGGCINWNWCNLTTSLIKAKLT